MYVCIYVNIYVYKYVCVYMYVCAYEYPYVHACGYVDMSGYDFLYNYMSTRIIKLMVVLIIYLVSTFVHGFVFKTCTPLSTF